MAAGCAASLLIVGAGSARADNGPHVAGAGPLADSCAGCHRAHTAKAPRLLKSGPSGSAFCYTCHGSSASGAKTDVEDGVGYSGDGRTGSTGALRGGGFAYALIDSANPSGQVSSTYNPDGNVPVRSTPEAVTSTHSVDGSDKTAWGNGAISSTANYGKTVQLGCTSCHDPHGNGNYRILRPIPKDSGATSPGVAIADASTKVYTTGNYWSVRDSNNAAFIANISAWCATCHTRYLAISGSARTDSGDAVFTYRHRSNDEGQGTPNCIQCHVSHGSNASQGEYSSAVPLPDGTTPVTDSRLLRIDNRGVCQMCHSK